MPLQITHKRDDEVPKPGRTGKVNEDLAALIGEMRKLAAGMVLEIETGSQKSVRGTKTLVTRAAKQLGARWRHWHVGTKVFAKPVEEVRRRRGRKPKSAA